MRRKTVNTPFTAAHMSFLTFKFDAILSTADHGKPLQEFVTSLELPVRIHRSRHRLGLIQCRQLGAEMTHGDVIVVMDTHVEVQKGWFVKKKHNLILALRLEACNSYRFTFQARAASARNRTRPADDVFAAT